MLNVTTATSLTTLIKMASQFKRRCSLQWNRLVEPNRWEFQWPNLWRQLSYPNHIIICSLAVVGCNLLKFTWNWSRNWTLSWRLETEFILPDLLVGKVAEEMFLLCFPFSCWTLIECRSWKPGWRQPIQNWHKLMARGSMADRLRVRGCALPLHRLL